LKYNVEKTCQEDYSTKKTISKENFINIIREEWEGLEKNVIVNSINSMRSRVQKHVLMLMELIPNTDAIIKVVAILFKKIYFELHFLLVKNRAPLLSPGADLKKNIHYIFMC